MRFGFFLLVISPSDYDLHENLVGSANLREKGELDGGREAGTKGCRERVR